jgi:hypothetical protein
MRKLLCIRAALATFGAAFLHGAAAHAGSSFGYWNNSGFSISHQFFPGLHSNYSYYNYAPRYYGFNRYYYGFNRYYSGGSRPHLHSGAAESDETPVAIDWAKKSVPHVWICRATDA